MDQPGLDQERHVGALQALARINALSGSAGMLWPSIRRFAQQADGEPIRLVDIACGGGDVANSLWRRARRARLPLEVAGADVSPVAVEHARGLSSQRGAGIEFFCHDLLTTPFPQGYDVVTCCLFLHHLATEEAVQLLERIRASGARLILVNDLLRSPFGLALAHLACRLLTRNQVVHMDGPISVRAAYSMDEARAMARQAGLAGATVRRRWPERFLLEWRRP